MTRRGVTLVEVLFAIGLILVGMVGLISVIPVAGHQAQDTISLNAGAAMATSAYGELKSRQFLDPDNWVTVDDTALSYSLISPLAATSSVCIDPLYMADRRNYVADTVATGGYYIPYSAMVTNGHRRFRFPYYKENHNPLVDPSLPTTAATQWPTAGTRLTRVSVDRPAQSGVQMISQSEAMLLSQGGDDLAVYLTKDRTLNPVLESSQAIVGGIPTGQTSVNGRFSWMATVNPLPGSPFASVSTVIFRTRDRSFYTAANHAGPAAVPRDNASGERLAYVTEAYGFQGGAGGTVVIAAARNTPSKLRVNDWLMMSRNVGGATLHRWYRVMSTIDEPLETTMPDPVHGTTREIWARRIMLDGPDWSFGFPTGAPADSTVADNTVVTLVDNVVAVTEHTVRIQ